MLSGEIALRQGGYDSPQGHSRTGLDFTAHLELMDALSALVLVRKRDSTAYRLLVRDIGRPCSNYRHFPNGHCDRLPLREIGLSHLTWGEAEEQTAAAVELWQQLDCYQEA